MRGTKNYFLTSFTFCMGIRRCDVVLYKFELWSCCFLCRTRRELAGARRELEAANASKKEKGGTKV